MTATEKPKIQTNSPAGEKSQSEIAKVLDEIVQYEYLGHDWLDCDIVSLIKTNAISKIDIERLLTLAYRAGRESRDAEINKLKNEIVEYQRICSISADCMNVAKETIKKLASRREMEK